MREIKFRGRTVSGDWVYGDLTHDAPNSTAYYQDGFTCRIHWMEGKTQCNLPVEDETVGEFTGLLDKNGKGVYEGNIVRFGHYVWVVIFDNGSWVLSPAKGLELDTVELLYDYSGEVLEVIGDVYKSP
jgi:hypothetical protein